MLQAAILRDAAAAMLMLSDDAITRYARQIIVAGIGAAGQEKLLATTVLVVGHPRGAAQAKLYLEAAGVHVVADSPKSADIAIVAGTGSVSSALLSSLAELSVPVCWYCISDDGFVAGVHPVAPLPASPPAHNAGHILELHDVAACDAAGTACAIALGLAHREDPLRFNL